MPWNIRYREELWIQPFVMHGRGLKSTLSFGEKCSNRVKTWEKPNKAEKKGARFNVDNPWNGIWGRSKAFTSTVRQELCMPVEIHADAVKQKVFNATIRKLSGQV